jgi:hypothetical protein
MNFACASKFSENFFRGLQRFSKYFLNSLKINFCNTFQRRKIVMLTKISFDQKDAKNSIIGSKELA